MKKEDGRLIAGATEDPKSGWSWKRCQDCGAVFCGGPLARFCLDCRKAHVARSSRERRLCDIGARARWGAKAKEEGRSEEPGKCNLPGGI